ncbi:MAG: hypothetical protein LBM98_08100 [Oscillospiraceae bacterium]|jgi:hypothetical protein|nr:hypothetical protein [Oscillospiraceae bacterium]
MELKDFSAYDLAAEVAGLNAQGFVNFFEGLVECLGLKLTSDRSETSWIYEVALEVNKALAAALNLTIGG